MARVSRRSYSSAACRTAPINSSGCQGFFKNWKMCPWLIAVMIDSKSANPVNNIRMACGCRALSRVNSSIPVICGIRWSDITMCTSSSCIDDVPGLVES